MHVLALVLIGFAVGPVWVAAQESERGPEHKRDCPVKIRTHNPALLDSVLSSYVADARRTYPKARDRFQKGLPTGYIFAVVTRFRDSSGIWEQAFVDVDSLGADVVFGRVASEITAITGYHRKDAVRVREAEILDWVIVAPDGSEEGNFVGKFLDRCGGQR